MGHAVAVSLKFRFQMRNQALQSQIFTRSRDQWEIVTCISPAGFKALETLLKVLVDLEDELLYQDPGTRHLVDGKPSKTER